MKNYKFLKSIPLFLVSSVLLSCSPNTNNEISFGFLSHGESYITSRVALGLKANNKQSLLSSFNIYIGAVKGFEEKWNNDYFKCNPGHGYFAVGRRILDDKENLLETSFKPFLDFPNDEKYSLIQKDIEGTYDGYQSLFSYFYTDEFDFSTIKISKGFICYSILFYDDINMEPFKENVYQYGIDWGGQLSFEIKDNSMISFKTGINDK